MYLQKKPLFFDVLLSCSFFLAIAYVLIGNGLYDEAIRQFSTMLQVSFLFGLFKQNIALKGKKTHFIKLSTTTYGFY